MSVFTLMKILRIESTLPSSHIVGKPFLENENSTKSNMRFRKYRTRVIISKMYTVFPHIVSALGP